MSGLDLHPLHPHTTSPESQVRLLNLTNVTIIVGHGVHEVGEPLVIGRELSGLRIEGESGSDGDDDDAAPQTRSWISGGKFVDETCWEEDAEGVAWSCLLNLDSGPFQGLDELRVLRVGADLLTPARYPDEMVISAGGDGGGRIPAESSFLYVNKSTLITDTEMNVWVFNVVTGLSATPNLPAFMTNRTWRGASVKM